MKTLVLNLMDSDGDYITYLYLDEIETMHSLYEDDEALIFIGTKSGEEWKCGYIEID